MQYTPHGKISFSTPQYLPSSVNIVSVSQMHSSTPLLTTAFFQPHSMQSKQQSPGLCSRPLTEQRYKLTEGLQTCA